MASLKSVCVYCGSSNEVKPDYLRLAQDLGRTLAQKNIRLVYGGGGVGLMGACARAVHSDGGEVLGIMPRFLLQKERIFEDVPHEIVDDMHTRKQRMFDLTDVFVSFPGGIGTLDETVEIITWKQLHLHSKPVLLFSPGGYWQAFDDLLRATVEGGFTDNKSLGLYETVDTLETLWSKIEAAGG